MKKFQIQIRRGSTIRDLLNTIQQQFETGKKFVQELYEIHNPNKIRSYVKFMINGIILFLDMILDATIDNDGDVVAIFPPIGSG